MHAVSFAARQDSHLFLLVSPGKSKLRTIGTTVDVPTTEVHQFIAATDGLPDCFTGRERITRLIHVCNFHGVPNPERAAVGLLGSNDEPEHGGFSGAVRADHSNDAPGRQ